MNCIYDQYIVSHYFCKFWFMWKFEQNEESDLPFSELYFQKIMIFIFYFLFFVVVVFFKLTDEPRALRCLSVFTPGVSKSDEARARPIKGRFNTKIAPA